VSRDTLEFYQHPEVDEKKPLSHKFEEVFQIVISLPSLAKKVGRAAAAISEEAANTARIVDGFLRRNPCFMPIHDPYFEPSSNNDTKIEGKSANGHVKRGHGHGKKLSRDFYSGLYYGTAIFVRLPSFPFYSTCKMYTYINKRQFPKNCPNREEDVLTYWLGNIGWSNNLLPFIDTFRGALRNSRILITPRARDNGAEKALSVLVNGKMVKVSGTWGAWADREECPIDTFAWDPWACHYISLSNCNNPELHDLKFSDKHDKLPDPDIKNEYMNFMVRICSCDCL
jgi:hypothetical protein